ncbi:MAG: hypothetical protein CTY12_00780 [Methylotenera sp.]|nr:MAG: hypothetical protein CTY12_00780 [Methylotenera sp.]
MTIQFGATHIGEILKQHSSYVEMVDLVQEGKKLFEAFDDHDEYVQRVSNWKKVCKVKYNLVTDPSGEVALQRALHVRCPYCGRHAKRVKGGKIWPYDKFPKLFALYQRRSYWLCLRCDAYVGCHPKGNGFLGNEPLGTLAKRELRILRHCVHNQFDPLWKSGILGSRSKAYRWLSDQMGLDITDCHIGLFNEQQCERALEIIGSFLINQ